LSRHVEFIHPVSKEPVVLDSPLPDDPLWTNMKLIR
jgi:23S rRNA pseudouridine1911/1915/1917 synthase